MERMQKSASRQADNVLYSESSLFSWLEIGKEQTIIARFSLIKQPISVLLASYILLRMQIVNISGISILCYCRRLQTHLSRIKEVFDFLLRSTKARSGELLRHINLHGPSLKKLRAFASSPIKILGNILIHILYSPISYSSYGYSACWSRDQQRRYPLDHFLYRTVSA